MASFLFYFGSDSTVVKNIRSAAITLWGEVKEVFEGCFWLFVPAANSGRVLCQSADALGAVAGYVCSDNLEGSKSKCVPFEQLHNKSFIEEIVHPENWPLGDHWSGSFGAVAYSKRANLLIICNDLIGYIPVYYSESETGVIGGTSLIALSHAIRVEADVVGLLQRITRPYCNYGRRTLLKPISRLLPGEKIHFSLHPLRFLSAFDNSLCKGVIDTDIRTVARGVWDCLKREIQLAASVDDHVYVAMSGGWDSRLVLGGLLNNGNAITCLTYGDKAHYESTIANRCASAAGAGHECFSIQQNYFPHRSSFEGFVRETEAIIITDP